MEDISEVELAQQWNESIQHNSEALRPQHDKRISWISAFGPILGNRLECVLCRTESLKAGNPTVKSPASSYQTDHAPYSPLASPIGTHLLSPRPR